MPRKKAVPVESLTIPEQQYIRTNLNLSGEQLAHIIGKPAELVVAYIKDNGLNLPTKSQRIGFTSNGNGATSCNYGVSRTLDETRRMRGKRKPFINDKLREATYYIDPTRQPKH